jgi:homocysteine S-methyltransferase
MASKFLEFLATKDSIILDGALATELERRGCNLDSSLWSAEVLMNNSILIYETHLDYFKAGADIAITASYQASVLGFETVGISSKEALRAIAKSVQLAKEARAELYRQDPARKCFIAGSIGPYGAYLANGAEYRGDYALTMSDMKDFHRPRMKVLLEEGVDVLACETIPSFEEAKALLSLLQEFPTAVAWFSFTLRDATHISDETAFSAVMELLNRGTQVVAIGVNCTSSELVDGAVQCLSQLSSKSIVVYPNSGEQYDASTNTWSGTALKGNVLAHKARNWHALGAKMIGACCRSTPDDIRVIKNAMLNPS